MLTVASNEAMRDHIEMVGGSSDAGMARVYELYAEAIDDTTMDDATARHFYSQASRNYGCAGAKYAEWLAQNKDAAKQLVQSIEMKLSTGLKATSDERFWITTMSCLLGGAMLATKLGICTFNVPELKTYLVEQFKEMRTIKKTKYEKPQDHSLSMVARFIHEHKDHTIKSDLMPSKGKRDYRIMRNALKNPPCVRIAVDDAKIRVITRDFEGWLYERYGATVTHIMKDLKNQGMIRTRGSIDAGTDLGGGRQMCLDFPLVNPAFKRSLGDLAT